MTATTDAARAQRCAWCSAELEPGAERLAGRTLCRCGAATTDPWPSDEDLERAYGGSYRPDTGRFAGLGDGLLRRTRGLLARRLDEIAPAGPVLDVGAGDGALLDALAERGRVAVGLERRSSRADIQETPLEETDGEWAAVVLWHSLEHLRAPGEALAQVARLLAPRGVAVVAMPNAASLQARLFGDRWFALDLPRHLVHLPAPVLIERLRELGLTVERVSWLRGGQSVFGWLHGLVGRLPGRPNLYDAVRRPEARSAPLAARRRVLTLAGACLLLPAAAAGAVVEALLKRGGTVYVEARRG